MIEPIKPSDIANAKLSGIPEIVISTFNSLLAETVSDGYGVIKQAAVIDRLVKAGLDRSEIFARGWLDVEDIYRRAGWKVEYDKPGFNETRDAYFTFTVASR